MIKAMLNLIIGLLLVGCGGNTAVNTVVDEDDSFQSLVDSTSYNKGILLFNADQGKQFWTEFNTQIRFYWTEGSSPTISRIFNEGNPYITLRPNSEEGQAGLRFSLFKTLFDDITLPEEISSRVRGIRFTAYGYDNRDLFVEIKDATGSTLIQDVFELKRNEISSHELYFSNPDAKEFLIYTDADTSESEIVLGLDDVYLITESDEIFEPPVSDDAFLAWLKRASFNFFDWNYVEVSADKGVILESNAYQDKVSASGIGYAYAIYVLAIDDGYYTFEKGRDRVVRMLNWQLQQNWFDGTGGWHGFPHHYFRKDGSRLTNDVSTIDWAINAAGLRVVRAYFENDPEIQQKTTELLTRARWQDAIDENDKIVMGFDDRGEKNNFRWGLAFSEETELVYLEAVASGALQPSINQAITRELKEGFYPSWFGAGFTYNWLQLWTGAIEPYKSNSTRAFEIDAASSREKFGVDVMGLTACSTIREADSEGFFLWDEYISNQGGLIRLTSGSVLQISPAPYGAALALPFTPQEAMSALREYANMGYYHEYLGLPDNVRLRNVPGDLPPAPNWDPFDINIAPVIMAIEMTQGNQIGQWFLRDHEIQSSLDQLIQSFE